MAPGKKGNVMQQALLHVIGIKSLWDKWICDETLYCEVKTRFTHLETFGIDRSFMNRVIAIRFREVIDCFDANSNKDGVFRYSVFMEFPYSDTKRKLFYYCITEPGKIPSSGRPSSAAMIRNIRCDQEFISRRETRNDRVRKDLELTSPSMSVASESIKRMRMTQLTSAVSLGVQSKLTPSQSTSSLCSLPSQPSEPSLPTYWDSPEAHILFNVPSDASVLDTLEHRITLLQSVNKTHDSYKNIVIGHDHKNQASTNDIWVIQKKATVLSVAYTYAVSNMNDQEMSQHFFNPSIP